jgi:hypothetical protein
MLRNDDNTGAICLICYAALSGFRKANCQRHYDTHHNEFKKTYPANAAGRKSVIGQLKIKLQQHKKPLTTPITVNESSTEVSIVGANKLFQHGMTFASGDIIK